MKKALINGKAITPYRVLDNATVLLGGGKVRIVEGTIVPDGYETLDYTVFFLDE